MIHPPIPTPPPGVVAATMRLLEVTRRAFDVESAAESTERRIRKQVHVFERQNENESTLRVAQLLHRRVDRALAEQDLREPRTRAKVQCSRGCTACCYQLVSVSEPEARLAIEAARQAGHEIDMDRARRQTAAVEDYMLLPHADRRCVMLRDDGDCAIYAARPTSCRSYRVLNDPVLCDLEKSPGAGTLVWVSPETEVLVSAAMRLFRSGPLADFIVEASEG